MATIPRSQNHLAELLGIAKSAMSQQARRGCPIHSLEAAQAWRKANLDPARRKGARFDKYRQRQKPGPAPPEALARSLAAQASALLAAASAVLETGQTIEDLVPSLRAALLVVPTLERAKVALPLRVIDVLVADVLAMLPPQGSGALNDDGSPVWRDGTDMSDEEAQELGEFWYQVAAGEIGCALEQDLLKESS